MRITAVIAAFVMLSGCSMGYWPKVEGDTGTRYQADVRDCQTSTQSGVTQAIGGAVWLAMASNTDEGKAAIDACMAQRGYRVNHG